MRPEPGELWRSPMSERAVIGIEGSKVWFEDNVLGGMRCVTMSDWKDWSSGAWRPEPALPPAMERPDDIECPICPLRISAGELADGDYVRCRCGALFTAAIVVYAVHEYVLEEG